MSSSLARTVAVTVTAAALLITAAVPSAAAPPGPAGAPSGADPAAVAAWPAELQQLVAGTPAFTSAPWFTDGDCTDRGGDVGVYVNTFFQREAAFRTQLTSNLVNTVPEWQGTDAQAQTSGQDEVFPNGNTAYDLPVGVCAADLLAWGTPDASSPWGFTWAPRPDTTSLRRMDTAGGVNQVNPLTVCTDDPDSYLCSRAMFVDCDKADTTGKQRCLDWNFAVQQHLNGMAYWISQNKSVLDRVGDFFGSVGHGLWTAGAWVVSGLGWVLGKVGDAAGWLAKKGMEQVVAFFTSGAVWLWGQVTAWMVNSTTPNLSGGGYADTYNLISGVMLAMAFLIWLAGLATAWRRGRLTGSVLGAVKAIVGIQIVGIIAFLMLQLANQATLGLISGQQTQIANSDFTFSLFQVNPVVGLIAAVLTILGLLGAGLVLVFQAPVTLGHALFGTVAAAGQAHHATSHWMGRWFITLLSLSWCKFFMVGMTILAQNLLTSTTANLQQNVGQQLFSVLAGMLLMLLLPTTPWLLSGVMSFTVGHASAAADRMAQGMTAAIGTAAAAAASGPALAAGGAVAGAGAESMHALATMSSNSAALGALNNGTFGAGGAAGGGAGGAAGGGAGDAAGGDATPKPPQQLSATPGGAAPGGGDSGDAPSTGQDTPADPGSGAAPGGGSGEPPPDPQDADRDAPQDLPTAAAGGGARPAASAAAGTGRQRGTAGGRRTGPRSAQGGGNPAGGAGTSAQPGTPAQPGTAVDAAIGTATPGSASGPVNSAGPPTTSPGTSGGAPSAAASESTSTSSTAASAPAASSDGGSEPAPFSAAAPSSAPAADPGAAGPVQTPPSSPPPPPAAPSSTAAPSPDDPAQQVPVQPPPPVAEPPVSEPPRAATGPPVGSPRPTRSRPRPA